MTDTKPPFSFANFREWKTAHNAAKKFFEVCERLRLGGLQNGAILEGLFLAAYDTAAAGEDVWAERSLFYRMEKFGRNGLQVMPTEGASSREPDWREIFDMDRQGHKTHKALWPLCTGLRGSGFSDYAVMDGLLRSTEEALTTSTEESRRYWFGQFETSGARGGAIAQDEISRAVVADSN